MSSLLKCYKTELNPTDEQKQKLLQAMGICRFLSNLYQAEIEMAYQNGQPYPSPSKFYAWINQVYLPAHPDHRWILDTHSKARKQALMDKDAAYKKFFAGKAKHPSFKKKGVDECSYYFVRNDKNSVLGTQRHRIQVPGLGWIRLKEKGYVPASDSTHIVRSGRITLHDDRFYVSVLMELPESVQNTSLHSAGLGIDLGIKDLAVCSNGMVFPNINKTGNIKKLKKQLRHAQRTLSRRNEALKRRTGCKSLKDALKKSGITHANIEKAKRKVAHLQARLAAIRNDYRRKVVSQIVKTKPSYLTIEHLNVKGMMKNRHLSRSIAQQGFYDLKRMLLEACRKLSIEVREVSQWYPSSKTCHHCGSVKTDLKLKDRVYQCFACGYTNDRDLNAALNLRDAVNYTVLA